MGLIIISAVFLYCSHIFHVYLGLSSNLLVDVIFLKLLKLHLMLNKGDAQNFDDSREIAQRLSQSETISVGNVLLEHLLDQAELGRQSNEHLRVVKTLFDVLGEQLFVLWKDFVEKVNHQEQNFKSDILTAFALRREV